MTLLPAKLAAAGYRTAMRGSAFCLCLIILSRVSALPRPKLFEQCRVGHCIAEWHYGFSRPEYLPQARGFEDHAGYLQGACDHLTEQTGCAVDSWRGNATHSGPDMRNNTGYDSWRHAADMVAIISRQATDPRPLFLYASLHVIHNPIEAPSELVAIYRQRQPEWCQKKHTLAAMVSVADNVTAQIVGALTEQAMWQHTVLVFSADNGGDSGDSSNFPLRGRKRTFFSGGVRAASFLASPMLPAARRGGRAENAFLHISDWYSTFLFLAHVSDDPMDTSRGARFGVDGRNLWPYLADDTGKVAPPSFEDNILVLGYNYSTLCSGQPNCTTPIPGGVGSYDLGSGALIEVTTGYKLIVGSQNAAQDTLSWDSRDYPCNKTQPGPDCTPHCLFNVLDDPQERNDLRSSPSSEHEKALERLLLAYQNIGKQPGMPNPLDTLWNEQGTPYDPRACQTAAAGGGYWQPWLPEADKEKR